MDGPSVGSIASIRALMGVHTPGPQTKLKEVTRLKSSLEVACHAVSQALLADIGNEGDGSRGFDVGIVQGANDGEHDGEPAAIVADSRTFHDVSLAGYFHVGAFGEDGVEMGGEEEVRVRGLTGTDADHVAGLINAHIAQAEFGKEALELAAANLLLERGRGNFANAYVLGIETLSR